MLAIFIAVLATATIPSATPPEAAPTTQSQPAAVQTADAKPARKRKRDEVVCKTVMVQGLGVAQRMCMTRYEWEERSANSRRDLMQMQRGFCGNGQGC